MSEGPPVLVVDDELPIRRFLRISLETNDYRVYEAENGDGGAGQGGAGAPGGDDSRHEPARHGRRRGPAPPARVDDHTGHHPLGA